MWCYIKEAIYRKGKYMRSIVVLFATILMVSSIVACRKDKPVSKSKSSSSEHATDYVELLAARPLPDLAHLAERSSPSYSGKDTIESFRDILKLRDVGDKEAVPVLEEILVEHSGSTRIHGFAAAQALFCIGTPEAHRILANHLLSSQYNVQLSFNYTYHWEMAEPKRSRFIKRYHLQNLSKDLTLKLKFNMYEMNGQLIDFTVTLHNVSGKPLEFWERQVYLGQMLYFQRRDGNFARCKQIVVYQPPMPLITKLQSGATHVYNIAVRINDAGQLKNRPKWLSEDTEIVAGTPDVMFELGKAGRFKVYAMFEQQPLPQTQIDHFKINNPWSGRAVSEPVTIDISLQN